LETLDIQCAVKGCPKKAIADDTLGIIRDEEGKFYGACEDHGNDEYAKAELRAESQRECPECDGEGSIEQGPFCNVPVSRCCGGCFTSVPCEMCNGEAYEQYVNDDYDYGEDGPGGYKARLEEDALNKEVEWESPV
jgi:hypothetical protein